MASGGAIFVGAQISGSLLRPWRQRIPVLRRTSGCPRQHDVRHLGVAAEDRPVQASADHVAGADAVEPAAVAVPDLEGQERFDVWVGPKRDAVLHGAPGVMDVGMGDRE